MARTEQVTLSETVYRYTTHRLENFQLRYFGSYCLHSTLLFVYLKDGLSRNRWVEALDLFAFRQLQLPKLDIAKAYHCIQSITQQNKKLILNTTAQDELNTHRRVPSCRMYKTD